MTEEKPNTPDQENQQGTNKPQTEAQGNDTEPEVTKSRPQICVPLVVVPSFLVWSSVIFGFDFSVAGGECYYYFNA